MNKPLLSELFVATEQNQNSHNRKTLKMLEQYFWLILFLSKLRTGDLLLL